MKSGNNARRLAREIQGACAKHVRENGISYRELASLFQVPYRGAMTIMQTKEWTLDRAVTVAESLGIDVALYLDGVSPFGFQEPIPAKGEVVTGHHRITMNQKARTTMQLTSR